LRQKITFIIVERWSVKKVSRVRDSLTRYVIVSRIPSFSTEIYLLMYVFKLSIISTSPLNLKNLHTDLIPLSFLLTRIYPAVIKRGDH
jgi:hypothetical protein